MPGHTAIYFYQRDEELVTATKEEYPDFSEKEIRDHLKEQWDELDEEEKTPYEKMSRESKSPQSSPKKTPKKTPKKKTSNETGEMRPKKAKSAFFHYLYDPEIRSAAEEEHGVKGKELTSVISAQWRELDDKSPWEAKSEEEKAELEKNPVMVARKKSSPRKKTSAKEMGRIEQLEKQVAELLERVAELEAKEQDSDEDSDED